MRREAEESDAKIEKTLDVSDDISPTRNMVEIDNSRIATSESDPLLLTVKAETNSGADAENIDFAGVKSGEEDLMEKYIFPSTIHCSQDTNIPNLINEVNTMEHRSEVAIPLMSAAVLNGV